MLNPELVHKHIKRLVEVTVKSHTSRSKKGKVYTVKSYDRDVKSLIGKRLSFKNTIASGDTDAYGSRMSGIFKGIDSNGNAILKTAKRGISIPASEIPALRKLLKKQKMARAIKRDAAAEKTHNKYRRGPAPDAGEWS